MNGRPQHLAGRADPSNEDVSAWARLIVEDDYWPPHSYREDVVTLPRRFVRGLAAAVPPNEETE